MSALIFLIPISLMSGALGLALFWWSIETGQYDDIDGSANRILIDEDDMPL
ncbi:MAG: cbb3-type cytochrome oxidase assembly protein CcoS [Novosphingobium sp.]|nr:cbb3-type cytochrome oxidase assembly protein CcoS [Novosphingobium sp.]